MAYVSLYMLSRNIKDNMNISDIYAKQFTLVIAYNPHSTPGIKCHYSHFTDGAMSLSTRPVLAEIKQ